MPINPDAVGSTGEPGTRTWTSQDSLLYALGVGAGATDPTGFELEFTTENSNGITQAALPTMPVILGAGSGGLENLGSFNMAMLVHGEQAVELHQPVPVEGTLTSQTTIANIWDKGKGAVVELASEATLDGAPLFTTRSSLFIRGEGGWGGERGPSGPRNVAPDRDADVEITYSTRSDQALLYRLSGDRNPLHSDPTFADMAGFPKPILHGLCTYGFTGRALLHGLCGGDPTKFTSMEGRFSSPVMPGEDLTVKMWVDGNDALFVTTGGDGRIVLDGGRTTFTS